MPFAQSLSMPSHSSSASGLIVGSVSSQSPPHDVKPSPSSSNGPSSTTPSQSSSMKLHSLSASAGSLSGNTSAPPHSARVPSAAHSAVPATHFGLGAQPGPGQT